MLEIDIAARVGSLDLRVKLPASQGTTVVIGPNGAGKSTLLKSVLGLVRVSHGAIKLANEPMLSTVERIDWPTEDRRIGYVPQSYGLFSKKSVYDNVAFGMRHVAKGERRAKVSELLEDLGIEALANRKPATLSGGEAQRVALARALAIGPRALLLDEPMAALDAEAKRKVRQFLVARLRAIGIPTIVVSHDADDVVALGGRVAVLEAGRIVQLGTLAELKNDPATPFVREFLTAPPAAGPRAVSEIRAW